MFNSIEAVKSGDIQHEPVMLLQRPSSARRQNVSHILSSSFGEYFARDAVPQNVVKFLSTSRSGDDPYHDHYVEELSKVQDEREKRLATALKLETHLLQAKGAATAADEKRLTQLTDECESYSQLGLPPLESNFKSLLDSKLLKNHHLIAPEDYSTAEAAKVAPPKAPRVPGYAQATKAYLGQSRLSGGSSRSRPESAPISNIAKDDKQNQGHEQQTNTPPLWKKCMEVSEREIQKFYLNAIQRRVDHLKNPRHVQPVDGRFRGKNSLEFASRPIGNSLFSLTNQEAIFIAEPNPVVFSNYKPGKVYKIGLQLKNITSASRHIRVVPPATSYFALSLGKFPSQVGYIAPGLACKFEVIFMPDTLADYDDELVIKTQSETDTVISLQGRRPPPILSLAATLDCGHCLIGSEKIAEFLCTNSGGEGRFCIMSDSVWPTQQFESFGSASQLNIAPFQLEPNYFHLQRGESITIKVKFAPQDADIYTRTIMAVCDNCQVKSFTLKGVCQTAGVEFVSVSEGLLDPLALTTYDISAEQHIIFDTIHVGMCSERKLVVHNTTKVDLPYHWEFFKPILCKPGAPRGRQSRFERYRVPRSKQVFCVEPPFGILQPFAKAEFLLKYSPQCVGDSNHVLHLILEEYDQNKASFDNNDELVHDVIPGLELELYANCKPFQVALSPSVIIFGDLLLIGTTSSRTIQMINNSFHPIEFEWKNKYNGDYAITVSPYKEKVDAGQVIDLLVEVNSNIPGNIQESIYCHIEHVDPPVYLQIQATVQGPQLTIDVPDLNFGLIRLGESVEKDIPIRNLSSIISMWEISECNDQDGKEANQRETSEFTFTPASGELLQQSSAVVNVVFKPTHCRRLRTVLELRATNGNRRHLHVRGEIQSPIVVLEECHLKLDEVYLGLPRVTRVTLKNQTLLATDFKWITDTTKDKYSLTFDPNHGDIGSRESITINVTFIYNQIGYQEILAPCVVTGMEEPLLLKITTRIKGLSVGYYTPELHASTIKESLDIQELDDNEKSLSLNFGQDIPIGANVKRVLVLRNKSAIEANYNARVTYFTAADANIDTDLYAITANKSKTESKKGESLLKRTANLADPQSKSIERARVSYSAAVLRDGRGAAFEIVPSHGKLKAFETKIITVTAFTDMWGSYYDNFVCSIENLDDVIIPIQLCVVGCPLKFQIGNVEKRGHPVVRFGAHTSSSPSIVRSLRINNTGPMDIRLDWKTFNVIKGDNQLVDLLVHYGEPLPIIRNDLDDTKGKFNRFVPSPIVISETPSTLPANESPEILQRSDSDDISNRHSDPLISVSINTHGGTAADDPYNVNPTQLIVPGRGHTSVHVNFTPPLSCEEENDCNAYALGYMSLDGPDTNIEGKVSRLQGYDLKPLRFDMTATVLPAWLSVNSADDEGNFYTAASSDLLFDKCRVIDKVWKEQYFSFTNLTDTSLYFNLVLPWPFEIRPIATNGNSSVKAGTLPQELTSRKNKTVIVNKDKDQNYVLLPQTNIQINIAFRLELDILHQVKELEAESNEQSITLITDGNNKKLCIKKDLQISFSNGSIQNVPLCATVALPTFTLGENFLNFGTCFVGQKRSKLITITNTTMSGTYWISTIEPQNEESRDIFTVEPNQSYIEANITHVTTSAVAVKITCIARHNLKYAAKVHFNGLLGEPTRILTVISEGSYDGKYQSIIE